MAYFASVINPRGGLYPNDIFLSDDYNFEATLQENGDFVIYPMGKKEPKYVIWSTGTSGKWVMNKKREMVEVDYKKSTDYIEFQEDGNLVLHGTKTDDSKFVIWDSNKFKSKSSRVLGLYFNCAGILLFRENEDGEMRSTPISRNNINISLALRCESINYEWKRIYKELGDKLKMCGKIDTSHYLSIDEMSGGAKGFTDKIRIPNFKFYSGRSKYTKFELQGKFSPSIKANNQEYSKGLYTSTGLRLSLTFSDTKTKNCLRLYYDDNGVEKYDTIFNWTAEIDRILTVQYNNNPKYGNKLVISKEIKYRLHPFDNEMFDIKYLYPSLGRDVRAYEDVPIDHMDCDIGSNEDKKAAIVILRILTLYWMQYFIDNGNPFVMGYIVLATDKFNAQADTPWKGIPDNLVAVDAVAATIQNEDVNAINIGLMTKHKARFGSDLVIESLTDSMQKLPEKDGAILYGFDAIVSKYFLEPLFSHLSTAIDPGFKYKAKEYDPQFSHNSMTCFCSIVDTDSGIIFKETYKHTITLKCENDSSNEKINVKFSGYMYINDDAKKNVELDWYYNVQCYFSKENQSVIKIESDDEVKMKIIKRGGMYSDWEEAIKQIKDMLRKSIEFGVAFPVKTVLLPSGNELMYKKPVLVEPDFSLRADVTVDHD